ncbi:MAG: phosphoglycerate kinase, partial [bacterium]|nr:phosphoglycerate kinase [bacterium]
MMEPVFFGSASLRGKRVLIRCNLNVPLKQDGSIEKDTCIRASIPTIRYVSSSGAKTILMGHLGNPHGRKKACLSMIPVGNRISTLLGLSVRVLDNCVGRSVRIIVDKMQDGEIVLLENLRFNSGEEKNCSAFARQLSELGDL